MIDGHNILSIEDLGRGTDLSVTNNIENIVEEELWKLDKTKSDIPLVIYRDNEGMWDGWDVIKEDFIILDAADEIEAVQKIKGRFPDTVKISEGGITVS